MGRMISDDDQLPLRGQGVDGEGQGVEGDGSTWKCTSAMASLEAALKFPASFAPLEFIWAQLGASSTLSASCTAMQIFGASC